MPNTEELSRRARLTAINKVLLQRGYPLWLPEVYLTQVCDEPSLMSVMKLLTSDQLVSIVGSVRKGDFEFVQIEEWREGFQDKFADVRFKMLSPFTAREVDYQLRLSKGCCVTLKIFFQEHVLLSYQHRPGIRRRLYELPRFYYAKVINLKPKQELDTLERHKFITAFSHACSEFLIFQSSIENLEIQRCCYEGASYADPGFGDGIHHLFLLDCVSDCEVSMQSINKKLQNYAALGKIYSMQFYSKMEVSKKIIQRTSAIFDTAFI